MNYKNLTPAEFMDILSELCNTHGIEKVKKTISSMFTLLEANSKDTLRRWCVEYLRHTKIIEWGKYSATDKDSIAVYAYNIQEAKYIADRQLTDHNIEHEILRAYEVK